MSSPTKTFLEHDQFLCQLSIQSLSTISNKVGMKTSCTESSQNPRMHDSPWRPRRPSPGRPITSLQPFQEYHLTWYSHHSLPLHPHGCSHQLQLLRTLEGGFLLADWDQLRSGKPVNFSVVQSNTAWTHISGPLLQVCPFLGILSQLCGTIPSSHVSFVTVWNFLILHFPCFKLLCGFSFRFGPEQVSHHTRLKTTQWIPPTERFPVLSSKSVKQFISGRMQNTCKLKNLKF